MRALLLWVSFLVGCASAQNKPVAATAPAPEQESVPAAPSSLGEAHLIEESRRTGVPVEVLRARLEEQIDPAHIRAAKEKCESRGGTWDDWEGCW